MSQDNFGQEKRYIKDSLPRRLYDDIKIGVERRPFNKIVIHHTGFVPKHILHSKAGNWIDWIHRTGHRDGYPAFTYGMGYHILINRDGIIEIGERWIHQIHGAHTKGDNQYSLGIAFTGDYNMLKLVPHQIFTFNEILKVLPTLDIFYHKELRPTECPGSNIIKYVNLRRSNGKSERHSEDESKVQGISRNGICEPDNTYVSINNTRPNNEQHGKDGV
jgi:hypothetical protein